MEQNELALKDFDEVINLFPQYIDAYIQRAVIKMILGQADAALQDIEQLKKRNINDVTILFRCAHTLQILGQIDSAIIAYQTLLEKEPRFYPAYHNLAVAYKVKSDDVLAKEVYQKAISLYDELIKIDTYNAEFYRLRGILHGAFSRNSHACRDFESAIKCAPYNKLAYLELIQLKIKLANQFKSEESFYLAEARKISIKYDELFQGVDRS